MNSTIPVLMTLIKQVVTSEIKSESSSSLCLKPVSIVIRIFMGKTPWLVLHLIELFCWAGRYFLWLLAWGWFGSLKLASICTLGHLREERPWVYNALTITAAVISPWRMRKKHYLRLLVTNSSDNSFFPAACGNRN